MKTLTIIAAVFILSFDLSAQSAQEIIDKLTKTCRLKFESAK